MTACDRLFSYLVELELIKFKLIIIYRYVYSYDAEGKYMFYIFISYTNFDTENSTFRHFKWASCNTKIRLRFYDMLRRYVITGVQLLSRRWNFPHFDLLWKWVLRFTIQKHWNETRVYYDYNIQYTSWYSGYICGHKTRTHGSWAHVGDLRN